MVHTACLFCVTICHLSGAIGYTFATLLKMSQKRKRLFLKEKIEILKCSDKEKLSVRSLADKFKVGKTQVSEILKNKSELFKLWAANGNVNVKRAFPKTEGLAIDNATYEWFCRARANNIPLSGILIREKALEIAKELGFADFKASNGWLEKFRIRHSISYKTVCGEAASVPEDMVSDWLTKLQDICDGYEEKDLFNCDETGLFFRALPDKTMCLKGETCSGGKISKERLTVMLCVNMVGDFENPLIIGKATKPRCFKGVNVNQLDIEWRANKKAWMTRDLMTEWLMSFDRKMGRQKRKVLLFLDNASSHPMVSLQNVKLIFLPPNTTSACQPLDQGIIKNFKICYRQRVMRHLLAKMDEAKSASKLSGSISVLDAIFWVSSSMEKISSQTVRNCFLKAGFSKNKIAEINDESDCDAEFDLEELVKQFGEEGAGYARIDEKLQTEDQSTNILELIDSVKETAKEATNVINDESDDGDDDDPIGEPIKSKDAIQHVNKLKQFFLQKHDAIGLKLISEVEMYVEDKIQKEPKKQTAISDFLRKEQVRMP